MKPKTQPIEVIWQEPTADDQNPIWERDWLNLIFQKLGDVRHVHDLDVHGKGKYSYCGERSIVVYSGDRDNEKAAKLKQYLKSNKQKLIVLFHLSDERLKADDSFYGYARLVIRNYFKSYLVRRNVIFAPLGCTNGKLQRFQDSHETLLTRGLAYNFMGSVGGTKKDREKMISVFSQLRVPGFVHVSSKDGSRGDEIDSVEYCKILEDSVFTLCPRGNRSLDCFRNYEAAMYGSIPVVVATSAEFEKAFACFQAPFLRYSSWEEASEGVKRLLMEPEKTVELGSNLQRWILSYPDRIAKQIRDYLNAD